MQAIEKQYKLLLGISICLILAVGRFYDDRLSFGGINISVFISIVYLISILSAFAFYKTYSLKKSMVLYLAFSSFIIISFINSYFIQDLVMIDNYNVTKFIEFIFISLLISSLLLLSEDFNLVKSITWAIFVLSLLLLVSGLFAAAKSGFTFSDKDRLAVFGGGPIVYARWIITGALFILFYLKVSWILKAAYTLFVLFLAIQSGSKGPIIGFFIAITCTYFLYLLKTKKASHIVLMLAIVGILSFSLLLFIKYSDTMPSRIKQLVQPTELQSSTSFTDRQERYELSSEILSEQKLGIGLSNWPHYYNKKCKTKVEFTDYPHNIFLEVGIESGWGALFVLSIIMLLVLYRAAKFYLVTIKTANENLIKLFNFLFSLFIFALINTNLSGDLSDDRLLIIVMASIIVVTENSVQSKFSLLKTEK